MVLFIFKKWYYLCLKSGIIYFYKVVLIMYEDNATFYNSCDISKYKTVQWISIIVAVVVWVNLRGRIGRAIINIVSNVTRGRAFPIRITISIFERTQS